MTSRKVSHFDKCIYACLVAAFLVTIILAILGLHSQRVPNTASIHARAGHLPINITETIAITSSKNDAGKHASLRWFEKVEVKNIDSDWLKTSLHYYCTQQDMIDYVDKLHGYISIRFITRNNQQFHIEKIMKEISFNPSNQCQK